MYSCRVPFDNDRQWSCYLMISNRFVHVKWGKSDNFWLRKRKKERNDSGHAHAVRKDGRTERTEGEDGRTLSAWRRFAGRVSRFGEFYLIDSPPFLIPLKNASFWPFFLSFPKSMFLPCFNHCSVNKRLPSRFRHCSRFVPVFLCPRLVSQRPVWPCMLNKTKNSRRKCPNIPCSVCSAYWQRCHTICSSDLSLYADLLAVSKCDFCVKIAEIPVFPT